MYKKGEKGSLTFARYREQDQATVARNIIGYHILDQLDVPLVSLFSIRNQTFVPGVSHGPVGDQRTYQEGRRKISW